MNALEIEDLSVRLGDLALLDRVSLTVPAGEVVGLVGESGSGKSLTALAVTALLPRDAELRAAYLKCRGQDILDKSDPHKSAAAMIFQNPRAALNPTRTIGDQLADVLLSRKKLNRALLRSEIVTRLGAVELRNAEERMRHYPHQLSGGECQRVALALALACQPELLIADEATTGLDVTTQAVILKMLRRLARQEHLGVLLITHDLALAATYCDRIAVIHAGQIVETGRVGEVFGGARHPYTRALLASAPALATCLDELRPLASGPPDLARTDLPACRFAHRCEYAREACVTEPAPLHQISDSHRIWCRFPNE